MRLRTTFVLSLAVLFGVLATVSLTAHGAVGGEAEATSRPAVQAAQPLQQLDQVGGSISRVVAQGVVAYVGVGPRFSVLDFSTPSQPNRVGDTLSFDALVEDVAISGTVAFVALGKEGCALVSLADPSHPTVLSTVPGMAHGVRLQGLYAYLVDGVQRRLRIVDAQNPLQPTVVGTYTVSSTVTSVAISGSYAYLGGGNSLEIVDISNPAQPTQVSWLSLPGPLLDLSVVGHRLFAAAHASDLLVVDVGNPAKPVLDYAVSFSGYGYGVAVVGSYAYVAATYAGVVKIYVPQNFTPTVLTSAPVPGWASDVAAVRVSTQTLVYVAASHGGLRLFSDTGPILQARETAPEVVSLLEALGTYETVGAARGIAVSGTYGYVADSLALRVLSLPTQSRASLVGSLPTPATAEDVDVSGSHAFLVAGSTLRVADVSNPANPTLLASLPLSGYAYGLEVSGTRAYVAAGTGGIQVVDVVSPAHPTLLASAPTADVARDVAVQGPFLYVADETQGLRIFHYGGPNLLSARGVFTFPGIAWSVAVSGTQAYVGATGHVYIVDVSDPDRPTKIGEYAPPGWGDPVQEMVPAGSYLYVLTLSELFVLDVSSPSSPRKVASGPLLDMGYDLTLADDRVVVAEYNAGITVWAALPGGGGHPLYLPAILR